MKVLFVSILLLVSMHANASLIDRGNGLIYDNDLNITWLADANYANTSGYASVESGNMGWGDAMSWADQLVYSGFTDWRLPSSDNCNGDACSNSEMGHLYFNELGGVAPLSIIDNHNAGFALFSNIQDGFYWSNTLDISTSDGAFGFNFRFGHQYSNLITVYGSAWAVRDGDVAAAPEPATLALMSLGLIGLGRKLGNKSKH